MPSRSLGHRAPLLWLVLPFIAGLVLAKVTGSRFILLPLLLALGCGGIGLWSVRRSHSAWAPALGLTMLLAGLASHPLHRVRLDVWDSLPAREAQLVLRVDRVFAPGDARRTAGLGTVAGTDPHLRELVGQRLYFSLQLPESQAPPIRGTVLSTVGVLVALPENPPLETFDGFLAGAGMTFRLTRGRVLGEIHPAPAVQRAYARLASFFSAVLGQGIEEKRPTLAGLLRAMMLGATRELSDEQHALFMQSGTMHLFAISGLNIGVIAGALQALLLLARLPAWPRFLIGAALLWIFVETTGASASAVRAFAMAVFVQAALVLRQPANVLAALVLSAFVVLLVSPLQVFSASFLMSYTIVLALLTLGLPLSDAWLERWSPWRELPRPAWRPWQRVVANAWRLTVPSLAIGLATMPASLLTGVQYFQLLTPGSLLTNLLLIPGAMIVTVGGFASLVCGLIGFEGGVIVCNHAAALVLWLIEQVVRLSVEWPGAFMPARFVAGWVGPVSLATLIGTLLAGYASNWSAKHGGWWPPVVVVGLTLGFGLEYL
jgi:competence protein ComEC